MRTNYYKPIANVSYYKKPIDFFARRTHFIDHLALIWQQMPERGKFYVPAMLVEYAASKGVEAEPLVSAVGRPLIVAPYGDTPVVVCAYGDAEMAFNRSQRRPLILMEHGVGLTFDNPGYAGGIGLRRHICLFLAPNKFIYRKTAQVFPLAPQVIVGTPKLDDVQWTGPEKGSKKVAISFHWDGSGVAPEAGNALKHYVGILPELAKEFELIGHGHPKIMDCLAPIYENAGISLIERDFSKVMSDAAVYVNDASSTMYEFCVTGKPVVILNAPWFRKRVSHGIRFWEYTNIGTQVEGPDTLSTVIHETLEHPEKYEQERKDMIADLYPYHGKSAKRAADAIMRFVESKRNGTTFKFT